MNGVGEQRIVVAISISAEEYLKVYRGTGKVVSTHDTAGRRVRFPANILQRFVTREGIYGVFAIRFDQQGRFRAIEKLQ